MPKKVYEETFLVTVSSDTPIKDLAAHVENRVWSMDHVTFVDATKGWIAGNKHDYHIFGFTNNR